jgi:glycosyltransferase involved in cell wall biosynthesis
MVAAVSMVRDEADIIEANIRRMATQVDVTIVADNGSTDGTREILDRLATEVDLVVIDDPEPGYFQSQKMTRLAGCARDAGADWVIPFDADEVWLARSGARIADELERLPDTVLIAQATLYDHVATATDKAGRDPTRTIVWRRPDPAPLPKVACRALPDLTIEQGNHGAVYELTDHPATVTNVLTVRHFPYRTVAQMASKARNGAAAYAATDLPADVGGHWRGYGQILAERGEDGIADVFHTWFWRLVPDVAVNIDGEIQPALVHDPI